MKVIGGLAALALLGACATAAPVVPAPSSVEASAPPRAALLLAAAGSAEAPTQAEIESALGPADITRRDGAGAALTYRLENCALLLLFSADAGEAMRLAEANASARRAGAPAPSLNQCAVEAAARAS